MRKLFWCSVAVAVVAAGGVFLASKSVERSPTVALGQTLVDLGGGEEAAPAGPGQESLFPEPMPVDEPTGTGIAEPMSEVIAVTDPSRPGHILIDDMDVLPPEGAVPAPTAQIIVSAPTPAPAQMPYCGDGENSGVKVMPYADGEESAAPKSSPDESIWELLRKVAREAITEPMSDAEGASEDGMEGEEECPEDNGHEGYEGHHHSPVCPYTGRSYPHYGVAPSAPEPMPEVTPRNNNEKKEPQQSESRKMTPSEDDLNDDGEEQDWPAFRIDTMEFRPSDAGFQPILTRPF